MWVNTATLKTYSSHAEVRSAFPNTSFPASITDEDLATVGVRPAVLQPKPIFNETAFSCDQLPPRMLDGVWVIEWAVNPLSPATVAANLRAVREELWEQIKTIRDHRTQTGGYRVGEKWFHSDTFSRTQQLGLLAMGDNIPAGMLWKTMDGSFIEMTPLVARQVFAAGADQDARTFAYAEHLRAIVNASDNPRSVNLNAGWPRSYQDTISTAAPAQGTIPVVTL